MGLRWLFDRLKKIGRRKRCDVSFRSEAGSEQRAATNRMRIQSCIDAILEANDVVEVTALEPQTVLHFKHLRQLMQSVDARTIREKELAMIEAATNRLLQDMGRFYTVSGMEEEKKHAGTN